MQVTQWTRDNRESTEEVLITPRVSILSGWNALCVSVPLEASTSDRRQLVSWSIAERESGERVCRWHFDDRDLT